MKLKFLILCTFYSIGVIAQGINTKKIEKYIQSKVDLDDFSGAVLVAVNNRIIIQKAYGFANRELLVQNKTNTKFRIGSITKQFTAAAILQLAEKNKLSLNDPITKFFPHYPNGDQITVHMLLNHSSGIKNYTNLPIFPKIATLPFPKDSVISIFRNEPLDFTPGTAWNYSNSGYFLLGCIVEKVSQQSFSEYIRINLIEKAALKNTSMDQIDKIILNRANGYLRNGKDWKNADFISMEFPFSAGAMISTIEDLFLWNLALHQNKIVSPSSTQKLSKAYLGNYGYGVFVDSLYSHSRIGHTGGIPGFISQNDYFPKEKIHIIILSNFNFNSGGMAKAIAGILFKQPLAPIYQHKAIQLSPNELVKFCGKFQLNQKQFEIKLKNEKLFITIPGEPEIELIPESRTKVFLADQSDRQIEIKSSFQKSNYCFINSGMLENLKKIEQSFNP
ncbi:MAG: hypothetical protein RJA76_535 [Bacteroidota bacterium]|jgi:CubicO group peptidase (beta-lactamase class C family)